MEGLVRAPRLHHPHLGGSLVGAQALSYVITGIALGVVYVLTGSMTAAMVSHAMQSWFSFGQILLFGHDGAAVSPVLWIIVAGCPLWVYLCASGLRAVLPRDRAGTAAGDGRSGPDRR